MSCPHLYPLRPSRSEDHVKILDLSFLPTVELDFLAHSDTRSPHTFNPSAARRECSPHGTSIPRLCRCTDADLTQRQSTVCRRDDSPNLDERLYQYSCARGQETAAGDGDTGGDGRPRVHTEWREVPWSLGCGACRHYRSPGQEVCIVYEASVSFSWDVIGLRQSCSAPCIRQ
ncbi:hypothetical protein IW261DRAFT_922853 [Armillaria novae-zelandiae]|uniref:Uncharacterized protein n=1 Tax=Armillaria novae-zelandiae TaxID=153914 RepID=A0AA39NS68_9AGAR|nr:hypothetical protein IW261DRAFT_922853 [Armillaria novae-zelandiae]